MPTGTRKLFKIGAAVVAAWVSTSPSASSHLPKQVEHESRNAIKDIGFPYAGPIELIEPEMEIKIIERAAPK
jgi:predicted transcriptional regulator